MSKLEDSTTEKRLKLSATLSHHYFVKVLDKNEETKANAVLFIMNTSISQKVMLSIFPVDRESFREGIHLQNLLIDVKNVIDGLPEGKLEYMTQIGKLAVFVFKFATMTPCSSASHSDFSRVIFPKESNPENKKLVLPELRIKRNVAWSFFILEDTYDHFTDDGRTVKPKFELPVVPYEE